jgi:hypothetical protein
VRFGMELRSYNFIFWKNAARQTLEKNATSGQRLIISHPAKAAKYVPRDDFFTIHGASYYLRKKCRGNHSRSALHLC